MLGNNWKARIDSALSDVGRDLNNMVRQGAQFVEGLETTERLVLLCLVTFGTFYLLVGHFRGKTEDERAGGRFIGVMFMTVAAAASLGWMASSTTTA
ncbi:MAG: hypothetical protein Q8L84_05090 [Hyphomonas sp.]|nr:hypothetical protein [Hyphomonas sp.]